MSDRDWLIPSIALTIAAGVFGLLMIPDYSGIMPAVRLLPMWMLVAISLGCLHCVVAMMRSRVERPIHHIGKLVITEWRTIALWTFCVLLAGLNMTTFMWVKPLLNYLVPFWADQLLADLDKA